MALGNPSFETAGASVGLASGWTTTVLASVEAFPDFSGGSGAQTPTETFDTGWGNAGYLSALDPGATTAASFGTGSLVTQVESFETEWGGNESYLTEIGPATSAAFTGSGDTDSFDAGWGSAGYLYLLDVGDVTAAAFTGSGATDSFDAGWWNSGYLTALGPGDVTAAMFDGGTQTVEDFEEVLERRSVTALAASTSIACAAHPYAVNDILRWSGSAIPGGFVAGVDYYVKTTSTNALTLALTLGGAAIAATTDSLTGAAMLGGTPTLYWSDVE